MCSISYYEPCNATLVLSGISGELPSFSSFHCQPSYLPQISFSLSIILSSSSWNNHGMRVGDIKTRTKSNNNNNNKKTRAKMYVIQALELHGCMFPGSLLPHLDNDQWKHTMFTNLSFYFRGLSCQNYRYITKLVI